MWGEDQYKSHLEELIRRIDQEIRSKVDQERLLTETRKMNLDLNDLFKEHMHQFGRADYKLKIGAGLVLWKKSKVYWVTIIHPQW